MTLLALLKIEHFERWLAGQITFGVDISKQGDYLGRYLAQHAGCRRSEPLRYLGARCPAPCTPGELMDWIRVIKREEAA